MKLNRCIYELYEETASSCGDKPALIFLGQQYSYSYIKNLVESLSCALLELGIKKGNRVILYTPNCPQWVIFWLALQAIEAIPVPVSPIYTLHDLEYIANDSESIGILCADTNFGYAKKLKEKGIIKWIIVTNIADMIPWWKRWIAKSFDRVPEGKVEEQDVIDFKRLLKSTKVGIKRPKCNPDDILEILYTGGTTKFPKGVPIRHNIFNTSFYEQLKISDPLVPMKDNVIVQGAPLFHVLGQLFSLGPICLTGGTVILMPRVNLDALMLYIQRYRAKTLFGVPTLYRMILEHDRRDSYDLSSLRYCFTGGDVLPLEVLRRWMDHFGVRIYQGYGATETCGGVTMVRVTGDEPLESIGTLMPQKEVRVVDPETLKPVDPGEPGELLVTSPLMIDGYWKKEEETRECFIELDGKVWYRTGDIVRVDKKGCFYFVDRTADMIKHKGYRISASEIESIIKDHPAVISACVVGVPDDKVGERIKAFVVLKEDARGISGNELIRWCKSRLTPYKIPHYIEFRDMLPKSKVGKYLRRELRREERERIT